MGEYTQKNRPIGVTTPLGEDALLLSGLEGTEALSELFHFRLELLAEKPISFDALLGQSTTVRLDIPGSPERFVNGILTRIAHTGTVQGPRGSVTFQAYRAELVPRLWLLGLKTNCRIFQVMSVKEILEKILQKDWQLSVRWELSQTYLPRDYCTQYRETDLAFISRLMEEEGIFYSFEHTRDGHTLVLGDSPAAHADLAGQSALTYEQAIGGRRPQGRILTWEMEQALTSCKYILHNHCFQLPESTLEARDSILNSTTAGQATLQLDHQVSIDGQPMLERFENLAGYGWRFDGVAPGGADQSDNLHHLYSENRRLAGLRIQEEQAGTVRIDGTSSCGHLLASGKFTLERHPYGDGAYVLSRVHHSASVEASYLSGEDADLLHEARFEAIPAELPYRPARRTPRPSIAGFQTALVVGPKGQDIFVDKYGRVKVKFHWDRRDDEGPESSCWLRVGQLWAGRRWGSFFWPRAGHEVIVNFLEGNPDRPIVVGSVYNARNMPPFELPENRVKGGIKSFSASGSTDDPCNPMQNFNGVVFHDGKGEEHLEVHGEKHIYFDAEESYDHAVNGPSRTNVSSSHVMCVGAMPVGSGSGGGTSPSFKFMTNTDLAKRWGSNFTSVCGVNETSVIGLNGTLNLGDKVDIIINPLAFLTELGGMLPGGILGSRSAAFGANLGQIGVVIGNQTNLNYGAKVAIHRGTRAAINDFQNFRKAKLDAVMASLISILTTVEMFRTGMNHYDVPESEMKGMYATSGSLLELMGLIDTFIAYKNQFASAARCATAAATARDPAILGKMGDLIRTLFNDDHVNLNHTTCTAGAKAEFADNIVQGATANYMVFAGSEVTQQSVIGMGAGGISMATGVPDVGGRMNIYKDSIDLAVGPTGTGAAFTMKMDSISLSLFGGVYSLVIDKQGIHLKVPENTDDLKPAKRTLRTLNATLNAQLQMAFQALQLSQEVQAEVRSQAGVQMDQ